MVFSADGCVLIKVLRQEKGHGAKNSSQNFPPSQIWGKLQERVYRSRIHRCSSIKRSGSGVHVFQLALEHTDGILNTHFSYVWYLYRRTLGQSCLCGCLQWTLLFRGDLTKPSITIVNVDIFYLNLAICLQLDIALLILNSVKIWHCLSELWQCTQRVTFFSWTQCSVLLNNVQ